MEVEFGLVANKIAENNGQCFIVGSYYRDVIEKNIGSEYHIATDLLPNEILDIFRKFVINDYSNVLGNVVIKINNIVFEIETFKKCESKFRKNNFKGYTDSIYEDIYSRDFTINAIYVGKDEIIDPVNGIKDVEDKVIRTIIDANDSFKEDPLRMVRALSIMAKHKYKLSEETEQAFIFNSDLISYVDNKISGKEIKTFVGQPYFIETFNKYQYLFEGLYPELNKTIVIDLPDSADDRLFELFKYFKINLDSSIIKGNDLMIKYLKLLFEE